ncbi:MAG: protoglobin domain-containing protein [Phycisphaerae bacterium]
MKRGFWESLKIYVGFRRGDAENVRQLAAFAEPLFPRVVDRFYEVILEHTEARAVFTEGPEQIDRQKEVLLAWLQELFSGEYDADYCVKRLRIGATHVQVGLQQHFMPLGMELIWQELVRGLHDRDIAEKAEKLSSLHKLLLLDLAIMMESYKDSYSERIRDFERQSMEAQLVRAEHLAEIGQLAASLAHEIKNPLAGISGAIQVIGASLPANNQHRPIIDDILAQIDRVDATVKDLLLYARPPSPHRQAVQLNKLIGRVLSVLRTEPDVQHVRVEFNEANGQATAYADKGQLEQLLVNLILNAAQASPEGGSIWVDVVQQDSGACLTVRDEGSGMTPEIRKRAMEPFYTTKTRGTGLGLAICRRIAESNGGSMRLNSEPGRGTTVRVHLPKPDDG